MKLEDLQIYQLSMELSDGIWNVVQKWGVFSKDTVGKQLVRAADSIGANIAEGFGRYHFIREVPYKKQKHGWRKQKTEIFSRQINSKN